MKGLIIFLFMLVSFFTSAQNVEKSLNGKKSHSMTNAYSIKPTLGFNSIGGAISIYHFQKDYNEKNWIIPKIVNLDYLFLNPKMLSSLGYREAKLSYVKIGINPFYRFCGNWNFSILTQGVLGMESLKGSSINKYNFLFGVNFGQGIYYFQNKGLFFGIGLFQTITSSEVYPFDMGFTLEIGFKI